MKDVFAQPQYAEVLQFPARANVGGKPTPTRVGPHGDGRADRGAHAGGAAEIAVPSGLEGKLEGDATAAVVNAGLVAERRLGVVRHRDVRSRHPGGPEGRHDARVRRVGDARRLERTEAGRHGTPADGRADAGADTLILGEGRTSAPRRRLQVRARPQPISAVAPGRVA